MKYTKMLLLSLGNEMIDYNFLCDKLLKFPIFIFSHFLKITSLLNISVLVYVIYMHQKIR